MKGAESKVSKVEESKSQGNQIVKEPFGGKLAKIDRASSLQPQASRTAALLRIAHRGASGHAPENTLPAFARAVELGTDAIETDLRPTREGAVVLIHDATLDRTTNGRGCVADFTLGELAKLDAGGGARIPTLGEFLLWARPQGLELFLEIKTRGSPRPGWIDAAVAAVEKESLLERATFLCFDADILARIKLIQPHARTGWLRGRRLWNPWPRLAALRAAVFAPEWKLVSARLVERAHRSGLRVVTWTVDEPHRMQQLMALGVDGLATNYPERLNQALAAARREPTPWQ